MTTNNDSITQAGLAAIGGGTVIENADRWPSPIDKIKLALAGVEIAIDRQENPCRIHRALTELVKVTGDAYRQHTRAIAWQSINDILDQLGNPLWGWTDNDPPDPEAVALRPCTVCGAADRECKTIQYHARYYPGHSQHPTYYKRKAVAVCRDCGHHERV